jgi:transaldolase / glucose-6-phosphate isomerase
LEAAGHRARDRRRARGRRAGHRVRCADRRQLDDAEHCDVGTSRRNRADRRAAAHDATDGDDTHRDDPDRAHGAGDLADVVRSGPPSYVAIMGYVQPTPEFDAAVGELRAAIRDSTRQTTTFGYGPRFLHSTGQLHKGGPKTGRFLQLIHDGAEDVEIPGESYTFTQLKHAQADGDLETLRAHGLPAARVRLDGADAAAALRDLTATIKETLS